MHVHEQSRKQNAPEVKCPLPFSWSLSYCPQGIVYPVILLFMFWQCRKLLLPLSRSFYKANMGFSSVEDLQLVYSICLGVTDPQWVSKQKRGLLRLWGNYFLFFFAGSCNAPSIFLSWWPWHTLSSLYFVDFAFLDFQWQTYLLYRFCTPMGQLSQEQKMPGHANVLIWVLTFKNT